MPPQGAPQQHTPRVIQAPMINLIPYVAMNIPTAQGTPSTLLNDSFQNLKEDFEAIAAKHATRSRSRGKCDYILYGKYCLMLLFARHR